MWRRRFTPRNANQYCLQVFIDDNKLFIWNVLVEMAYLKGLQHGIIVEDFVDCKIIYI